MSFAQKINQLFRRKPIAAAVSGDSGMMGDTVVQDMYDGSLNSVQGAPSIFGVQLAMSLPLGT